MDNILNQEKNVAIKDCREKYTMDLLLAADTTKSWLCYDEWRTSALL